MTIIIIEINYRLSDLFSLADFHGQIMHVKCDLQMVLASKAPHGSKYRANSLFDSLRHPTNIIFYCLSDLTFACFVHTCM